MKNKILNLINKAQQELSGEFEKIDKLAEYNQIRILEYMKECNISERHFIPSTGYGYSDEGRDQLEELYALVLEVRMP